MTEHDAEQRAADVRAVADRLAARPDEISRLVLEAHEAGRGDLGNVLASLAAVLEDRSNLLWQLDEARSELARRILQRNNAHKARITTEQERDEARQIARTLVHHHLGIHDATIECEVHLNLPSLPDWLTADPQQQPPT